MFQFLRTKITKKMYEKYINTGKIPENVLRMICLKIIEGDELNDIEKTVFYGKTEEINELLTKIAKEDDKPTTT